MMEVKVPVDCISQLALIPMMMQVHGKLNTHTGEAHGVAQLKRKFYPEVQPLGMYVVVRPHALVSFFSIMCT